MRSPRRVAIARSVPFLKTQKVRLPAAGELPASVQQGNAIPISLSEFRSAAHEYPIVFTSGDGGKTFAAVAALGVAAARPSTSATVPGRATTRGATRSAWRRSG